MTKKQPQRKGKNKTAIIYLGMNSEILPWNGSYQQRCNEYFFSLKINGKYKIQSHHGMPCTRGSMNDEFIRKCYEEMIEKETALFAREMKGLKEYTVVNGDSWNFFHPNYAHDECEQMSDDAKSDFLSNLEAKLKGGKGINKRLLTYDYDNFRDSSMDGAHP